MMRTTTTMMLLLLLRSSMTFMILLSTTTTNVVVVQAQTTTTTTDYCQACARGNGIALNDHCFELQQSIATTIEPNTPECKSSQLSMFQIFCCPEPPEDFCTLCPEGGTYNPNKEIPGELFYSETPLTCSELETNHFSYDIEFFTPANQFGVCDDTLLSSSSTWCECDTASSQQPIQQQQQQCTLCENGESPQYPNRQERFHLLLSCSTLEYIASFMNSTTCPFFVTEIMNFDIPSFCGCPNTSSPNLCGICPDGYEMIDPNKIVPIGDMTDLTCNEINESMKHLPTTNHCNEQRQALDIDGGISQYCCQRAPLEGCSLCGSSSDGTSSSSVTTTTTFDANQEIPNLIFTGNSNDDTTILTCGELQTMEDAKFSYSLFGGDPTQCSSTILERSSSWCKCTNVPISASLSCTLCPDGSSPPDLNRKEQLFFSYDCATFEYTTTFWADEMVTNNNDECSKNWIELFDFDAAAFCKCPNMIPPGICDVCPLGMTFRNPNSFLPDDSGLTCGDLEESLTFITTRERCGTVRDTLHGIDTVIRLCCEEDDDIPTNINTNAPAVGPTIPSTDGGEDNGGGQKPDEAETSSATVLVVTSSTVWFGTIMAMMISLGRFNGLM